MIDLFLFSEAFQWPPDQVERMTISQALFVNRRAADYFKRKG